MRIIAKLMTEIIFKQESFNIVGACMKVHRELGPGFLEAVYQEALEKEFFKQNIPFQRQPKLSLYYDGEKLKKFYIADFICYNSIILELKIAPFITNGSLLQLNNALKSSNQKLGILINFGSPSLTYKRIINPSV